MTLRNDQMQRLRELFFDATTKIATLAVVVDELRKQIEKEHTLHVFCLELEPLFRLGERDQWDALDRLRREFARGLRVLVAPILGNDVVIATSHSGANDFYCFAHNTKAITNLSHIARDLEKSARTVLKSIDV